MENKKNKNSSDKNILSSYKRISLNVPISVHEKISKYAEDNGYNYSQAIITLVQKSLQQDILMDALPKIMQAIEDEKKKEIHSSKK